jgi:hypothetical protein
MALNGAENHWAWLVGQHPLGKVPGLLTNDFDDITEHFMFWWNCHESAQFIDCNIRESAYCCCGLQSQSADYLRFR